MVNRSVCLSEGYEDSSLATDPTAVSSLISAPLPPPPATASGKGASFRSSRWVSSYDPVIVSRTASSMGKKKRGRPAKKPRIKGAPKNPRHFVTGNEPSQKTAPPVTPAPTADADENLRKAAVWAWPLLGALADDAAALSLHLPACAFDGGGVVDDDVTRRQDLASRMRVIRLRIALLESVVEMVVHTGSWIVVQVTGW